MKDCFFARGTDKLSDPSENKAEKRIEVCFLVAKGTKSTSAKAIKTPGWRPAIGSQNDATEAAEKAMARMRRAILVLRRISSSLALPFPPRSRTACGRTLELSPTYDALRVFRVPLLIPRPCEIFLPLMPDVPRGDGFLRQRGFNASCRADAYVWRRGLLSGRGLHFYSVG